MTLELGLKIKSLLSVCSEKNPSYWLGMDEWLADQFVRSQYHGPTQLTAAGRLMADLKALLQRFFEHVINWQFPSMSFEMASEMTHSRVERFRASPAFEWFLEQTRERAALYNPQVDMNLAARQDRV